MTKNKTAILLIIICISSCTGQTREKKFLAKYEFEDFSQYNNVSVFIRGSDREKNPIIMINAPYLIHDTSKVGLYVVTLDKNDHRIINTKWTLTEDCINADTIKLQYLVQTFMRYKIPRLKVDKQGNVFVYLNDNETLALVKFANNNEFEKRNKDVKWIKIKQDWYKPR